MDCWWLTASCDGVVAVRRVSRAMNSICCVPGSRARAWTCWRRRAATARWPCGASARPRAACAARRCCRCCCATPAVSTLIAHAVALRTQQGAWQGCVLACAAAQPPEARRALSAVWRSACRCHSNMTLLLQGTQGPRYGACSSTCQAPSSRLCTGARNAGAADKLSLCSITCMACQNADVRRRGPGRCAPGLAPGAAGRAGSGGGDARGPGRAGRPGPAHPRPGEGGSQCKILPEQADICLCYGLRKEHHVCARACVCMISLGSFCLPLAFESL